MDSQRMIERRFHVPCGNVRELIAKAESVSQEGGRIHGALLGYPGGLNAFQSHIRSSVGKRCGFVVRGRSVPLIELSPPGRLGHEAAPEELVSFAWQGEEDLIFLLSCQDPDHFEYLISRLQFVLLPDLARTFLSTSQMEGAIWDIATPTSPIAVRVREYVCRSLIDDPASAKRVRTCREWTDEEPSSVFDSLREKQSWLSSITIEVRNGASSKGRIGRDSRFSCDRGFGLFLRTILESYARRVAMGHRFLKQRDRLSSPTRLSRPIRVAYGHDVFNDKRQNARLIGVLEKLPDAELAVLHPNPYLHASLLDYSDGSSYEIWVTDPSSILIMPKRRATVQSFGRVCDHICDNFEEGEVRDL